MNEDDLYKVLKGEFNVTDDIDLLYDNNYITVHERSGFTVTKVKVLQEFTYNNIPYNKGRILIV